MRVFEGTAQIKTSPETATIEITNLGGGDRFVRVSTLMDSINGAGYEAEARKIHSAYMAESEAKLLGEHVSRYSKYSQASSFTCSDMEIEELFDTAQYVCGAAIHPNGSAVTSLEMPNNHGMGTYMDVWYTHAALLRANRVDEAMKIIRFWDSVYPKAKKIAQEAGVGGARFEWLLRYDGTPYLPGITEQIHNNVIPVVNIYEQYLYTGEKAILSKRFTPR